MPKRKSAEIESSLLQIAKRQCEKHGLEIRIWQAGTTSDVGVRPVGETVDKWLPLQAKTTLATRKPFKFFFKHSYEIDIIALIGNRAGGFTYSATFMKKNWHKLVGGKCMSVNPGQVWNRPLVRWPQLSQQLVAQWNASRNLMTEMELRMQCTVNSQREIASQMLLRQMYPDRVHEWPINSQAAYDRLCDGRRVQDKVVLAVASSAFQAKMTKKVSGKQVPYEEGDADVFTLCTIHERLRVMLVWEFESDELVRMGILKTATQKGHTSLVVTLCPESSMNELQMKVFGKNHHTSNSTFRNLKVLQLPIEYEIPECLRGRDP